MYTEVLACDTVPALSFSCQNDLPVLLILIKPGCHLLGIAREHLNHIQKKKGNKTYLIGSHCFVAYLPVDGTLNDARHQLGNVFVVFFLTWNLLCCEENCGSNELQTFERFQAKSLNEVQ